MENKKSSNNNSEINIKKLNDFIDEIERDNVEYAKYLKKKNAEWNLKNVSFVDVAKANYVKALVVCGVIAAATASITIPTTLDIKNAIDDYKEDEALKKATNDIKKELDVIIKDATYLKPDAKNNFIVYEEIADYINNCADKDKAIFTLYNTYGQKEGAPIYNGITDKTIKCLKNSNGERYDGLDDYIQELGVKDLNEYEEMMTAKVLYEYKYGQDISSSRGGK